MQQVPILSGIYADATGDFRTSYPVNLVPVAKAQGISEGYLRPGDGIAALGTGPDICRGAIVWNGTLYAVMGSELVTVAATGTTATIGTIGGTGRVTMVYGFSHLAIATSGMLWLYDGTTLAQNTDIDLGTVLDVVWVDGYFMTTDGDSLVVTDIGDPFSVNPLKYGSSEVNPDPIVGVVKVRNEIYAVNRNTIEVFDNQGGTGFPFARVTGAQIHKGAISAHMAVEFGAAVAFVGGGVDEPPSVWLGMNGSAVKLASQEIDMILEGYSETVLSNAWVSVRAERMAQTLYIHLPDQTLAYDATASAAMQTPVWYVLKSGGPWRVAAFAWFGDKWIVFDTASAAIGTFSKAISSHWGTHVDWEFSTPIIYSGNRGIMHSLELVVMPGAMAMGDSPTIAAQYTVDGKAWSVPRYISAARGKRLIWLQQGPITHWRAQRFTGKSDAHMSAVRLEAAIEPMAF